MVGNEFGGTTFYTAEGGAVPGADLVPGAVDNGLSGERWKGRSEWQALEGAACGCLCSLAAAAAAAGCRPTCSALPPLFLAVLANAMVALGLMVGTRLLAYLVLLLMHRLKRI